MIIDSNKHDDSTGFKEYWLTVIELIYVKKIMHYLQSME